MATLDSRVPASHSLVKWSLIAGHLGCLQCLNTINSISGPPGFSPPRLARRRRVGWGQEPLLSCIPDKVYSASLGWGNRGPCLLKDGGDRLGSCLPKPPRTLGSTWTPGSSRDTWLYQGHWDPLGTLGSTKDSGCSKHTGDL